MIVVPRHIKKESLQAMESTVEAIKSMNLSPIPKWALKLSEDVRRGKNARIRRYAKKHRLDLEYHPKPWIFRRIEGKIQIAMEAGYFAEVDGIFHQLVAE